ncbi:MarR family winged helix-turn-helix transcriptional regulator [Wohlfahrtiimonas larvae]|nr:MarR family transcriptional regulator [Wohlfahrtiimonas larvae]
MKINQALIEPTGLSFSSWQLVIHILTHEKYEQQGMTTAELAEDLLISRQAVQKHIKLLLEDEVLCVRENTNDKRSLYYCLSPKGEELCQSVLDEIYRDWMLDNMKNFSVAEIQQAMKILTHLAKL